MVFGIGDLIEPCLHRIEHMLVLPEPDSTVRFGRAARLELASLASHQVTLEDVVFAVRVGLVRRQFVLCRTDIHVTLHIEPEVLFGQVAALYAA